MNSCTASKSSSLQATPSPSRFHSTLCYTVKDLLTRAHARLAQKSTAELLTYLKEHQAEGIQQLYDLRKLRYTSLDISQFLNKPEDDGNKVLF